MITLAHLILIGIPAVFIWVWGLYFPYKNGGIPPFQFRHKGWEHPFDGSARDITLVAAFIIQALTVVAVVGVLATIAADVFIYSWDFLSSYQIM